MPLDSLDSYALSMIAPNYSKEFYHCTKAQDMVKFMHVSITLFLTSSLVALHQLEC